jgi:hypothetical protein
MVLAHGRALLATDEQTIMVEGDLRESEKILAHPDVRKHFNPDEPTAVLLVFVLHFVRDSDDPHGIIKTLMDAMAPGSHLVISHAERDPRLERGVEVYQRASAPAVLRSRREIEGFFGGLQLVAPGVVRIAAWRPEWPQFPCDDDLPALGGVGRKS